MKCHKCKKSGVARSDEKYFCKNHFVNLVEKRVRKEIRVNKLINKNDKVLIVDDGTDKAAVTKYLIEKIIRDPTVKIKTGAQKRVLDFDKIIIPWNLDDEAISYLKSMFEQKEHKFLHQKNVIKPLVGITNEEVSSFAKLKGLKYMGGKVFEKDIQLMIDNMEEKYAGTKFSILKTIRKTK